MKQKGFYMTNVLRILTLSLFCLILCLTGIAQSKRGPSTPEERSTAVKIARLLEEEPLHKDAKKAREWLLL